ncbi:MAG: radical SAM protein, partial [Bdellovibrionia bacterium]
MCHVHRPDKNVKLTKMKFSDFERISTQLEPHGLLDFRLFWTGELSLHPEFADILRHSSKLRNVPHIAFDSNVFLLDKAKSDVLLECGERKPIHIMISLDGVKKETYEAIRVRGNYEKVIANIDYLLSERTRRGLTYPKLTFQFIVMEQNKGESLPFYEFWARKFLDFGITPRVTYNGSWAGEDGVNFRVLFEELDFDGTLQPKAIQLFEETVAGLQSKIGGKVLHESWN